MARPGSGGPGYTSAKPKAVQNEDQEPIRFEGDAVTPDLDSGVESLASPAVGADPDTALASDAKLRKARNSPLFFVVILLLLADIGFGLGLGMFADRILKVPQMAGAGVGLAVLGVLILAYFLLFGDGRSLTRRASKKPIKTTPGTASSTAPEIEY